jgi:transposase InsO family protein
MFGQPRDRFVPVVTKGRRFASIEDAQRELDAWVAHYNLEREHQGIGDEAPIRRFELVEALWRYRTRPPPDAAAVAVHYHRLTLWSGSRLRALSLGFVAASVRPATQPRQQ